MLKFSKLKYTNGFTLIELLLVIAIAAIIFAFSAPYSLRFYKTQLANEVQSNIFSTLTQARHNALLQKNDSPWGVLIDPNNDQYVLFQGSSYSSRNVNYDEVYDLLSDVNVSGLTEVVFSKFTGISDTSGTSTITLNNITRQILVDENGHINRIVTESVGGEVVPEIPTDGLISYWSFDGNALDPISGNNGNVFGATLTTGIGGTDDTAYYFDGSISKIELPALGLNGTDQVTFNMWVKPESISTVYVTHLIGSRGGYWDDISLVIGGSLQPGLNIGKLDFFIYDNGTFYGNNDFSTNIVPLNTWSMVTFSMSGTTWKLYINGEIENTYTIDKPILEYSNWILGWDEFSSDGNLLGSMDEVGIWDRALSDEEISSLYNNNNGRSLVQ